MKINIDNLKELQGKFWKEETNEHGTTYYDSDRILNDLMYKIIGEYEADGKISTTHFINNGIHKNGMRVENNCTFMLTNFKITKNDKVKVTYYYDSFIG
jgi:hypothetical protein